MVDGLNVKDDVILRIAHAHDDFGLGYRMLLATEISIPGAFIGARLRKRFNPGALLVQELISLLMSDKDLCVPHEKPLMITRVV